jgi:S-adenosylmethionine:tRNA-ribosyltransferase-isomerase (queuine synthetase)
LLALRKRGVAIATLTHAAGISSTGHRPRVAHGVLSGMHEAGTSHFTLLEAFAPRGLLDRALAEAHARSYRQHEFGDFTLILPARAA